MKSNNITRWSMEDCNLGVPGVNLVFNVFRDMKSLEELCISCEEGFDDLNDAAMAGYIASLANCTCMRELTLMNLNMSTHSCAALSVIFPRMSALLELNLRDNLIDDGGVEVLVRGLAGCKHLHSLCLGGNEIGDNGLDVLVQGLSVCTHLKSLNLEYNRIGDDGLGVLIQELPTSVDDLDLSNNDIALARQLPLLRFKKLGLWDNPISFGGARVIAASLVNPQCHLEELCLLCADVGDQGAAIIAEGLRNNQRLAMMNLTGNNITGTGWNAFSSVLCSKASINATHGSNHTLQDLGGYNGANTIPQDIQMLLELNSDEDKIRVAARKILQTHRHLDMRPLFGREFDLLPYVVAWLERFAESRPDLKLSSIFDFLRAMPMKVTDRMVDRTNGKKRKHNN